MYPVSCTCPPRSIRPTAAAAAAVWRHKVADKRPGRRSREQRAVREAELHAEEYREVYGHAREVGVEAHHQVLAHERHAPDHLIERTQIYAARELECRRHEDIDPRLQRPRHEVAEHGHRKGPVQHRRSHINTALCIRRSGRRAAATWPPRRCPRGVCVRARAARP